MVACLASDGLVPPALSPRTKNDPSRLSVQRIFGGGEFEPKHVSARWLPDSSGYLSWSRRASRPAAETSSSMTRRPASKGARFRPAELIAPEGIPTGRIDEYAFSTRSSRGF